MLLTEVDGSMSKHEVRIKVPETHIDRSNRRGIDRDLHRRWGDRGDVVLDLTSVQHIDSEAVAWLLDIREQLAQCNRNLILIEVQDKVYEMLMLSRVDRMMPIYLAGSDEEEAA